MEAGSATETLRLVLSGVSSQRPSHSLFLGGEELPLEARMGGIFLGFLCAAALLSVLGRLRASQPPAGTLGLACWVLIGLTGLDGLNAFAFDGYLPHLYDPTTLLRLLTGLGAGLGVGLMSVPVVAGVVWKQSSPVASIENCVELGFGLALAGLVGALLLAGVGVLLWPAALAMLLAVFVAFGLANLYLVLLATGHARRAASWLDLRGVLVSSLGLVLLELGGLGALRASLASALGLSWGA